MGRLFDNDALIKELNELDEKLNPDPFPEDAFGGDDDNFDAVEDVLRRAGEPYISEDQDRMLRRLEERAHAEYAKVHAAEGGGVVEEPSLERTRPSTTRRTVSSGRRSASRSLAAEGEIPYAHLLAPDDPLLAGSRRRTVFESTTGGRRRQRPRLEPKI